MSLPETSQPQPDEFLVCTLEEMYALRDKNRTIHIPDHQPYRNIFASITADPITTLSFLQQAGRISYPIAYDRDRYTQEWKNENQAFFAQNKRVLVRRGLRQTEPPALWDTSDSEESSDGETDYLFDGGMLRSKEEEDALNKIRELSQLQLLQLAAYQHFSEDQVKTGTSYFFKDKKDIMAAKEAAQGPETLDLDDIFGSLVEANDNEALPPPTQEEDTFTPGPIELDDNIGEEDLAFIEQLLQKTTTTSQQYDATAVQLQEKQLEASIGQLDEVAENLVASPTTTTVQPSHAQQPLPQQQPFLQQSPQSHLLPPPHQQLQMLPPALNQQQQYMFAHQQQRQMSYFPQQQPPQQRRPDGIPTPTSSTLSANASQSSPHIHPALSTDALSHHSGDQRTPSMNSLPPSTSTQQHPQQLQQQQYLQQQLIRQQPGMPMNLPPGTHPQHILQQQQHSNMLSVQSAQLAPQQKMYGLPMVPGQILQSQQMQPQGQAPRVGMPPAATPGVPQQYMYPPTAQQQLQLNQLQNPTGLTPQQMALKQQQLAMQQQHVPGMMQGQPLPLHMGQPAQIAPQQHQPNATQNSQQNSQRMGLQPALPTNTYQMNPQQYYQPQYQQFAVTGQIPQQYTAGEQLYQLQNQQIAQGMRNTTTQPDSNKLESLKRKMLNQPQQHSIAQPTPYNFPQQQPQHQPQYQPVMMQQQPQSHMLQQQQQVLQQHHQQQQPQPPPQNQQAINQQQYQQYQALLQRTQQQQQQQTAGYVSNPMGQQLYNPQLVAQQPHYGGQPPQQSITKPMVNQLGQPVTPMGTYQPGYPVQYGQFPSQYGYQQQPQQVQYAAFPQQQPQQQNMMRPQYPVQPGVPQGQPGQYGFN